MGNFYLSFAVLTFMSVATRPFVIVDFPTVASFPPFAILDRHLGSAILDYESWACLTFCASLPNINVDMPVSMFHAFLSSTSSRNSNNFADKKLHKTAQLSLLLLLLAGDINTNPGPYQPKYPCGICNKAVKWKQQAIECEVCFTWYHKHCMEMSDEIFEALQNHASYTWICSTCGLPNFGCVYRIFLN